MISKQLNLGYQYTFENDNTSISLTKDFGVYFIKGFVNQNYINKPFDTFSEAKKEFKKLQNHA